MMETIVIATKLTVTHQDIYLQGQTDDANQLSREWMSLQITIGKSAGEC
jgi:hypothetical protein